MAASDGGQPDKVCKENVSNGTVSRLRYQVVKAAEEFVGIKKLKAEDIHRLFRANNDVGSQNTI